MVYSSNPRIICPYNVEDTIIIIMKVKSSEDTDVYDHLT